MKFPARLVRSFADVQRNFEHLEQRTGELDTYTVATRPTNARPGKQVFVSDGAAGAKFQGWDGSTWVNLG